MSRKVWSAASAQCRCYAGASSQIISFASRSSLVELLYIGIKHIESLPMAIGILKTKYEVCPPSNRRVVMPKEVTLMAMCLSHQTDANNMLYTKVLPNPLGPSRKNIAPSPWATALQWQLFPGKCWAARDSGWHSHGGCLYCSQAS
jgi:hypothetical protein